MSCIGSLSNDINTAELSLNSGRRKIRPLPAEIIEKLNAVTDPLKEKMGPSFDYFESAANDRTR